MPGGKDKSGKQSFRTFGQGDRLTAGWVNSISRAIAELTGRPHSFSRSPFHVKLIRMSEVLGVSENESSSDFRDREGIVQAYSPNTRSFNDTTESWDTITDALGLIYDVNEVLPCLYHEQSGKYVPLFGLQMRTAITAQEVDVSDESSRSSQSDVVGDSGEYPSPEEQPDTYPFKFTRVSFTEQMGAQGHATTNLNSDPGPDGYVHNLAGEDHYIAQGTEIAVFKMGGPGAEGQWFTYSVGSTLARWVTFRTPIAFDEDNDRITGCTVVRYSEGTDPGPVITVGNELGFSADANGKGYARLERDGSYYIWQMECPSPLESESSLSESSQSQ